MKIKPEFLDINISCPYTGKMVNTILLDPELYSNYRSFYPELFYDEIINEDRKAELEIEMSEIEWMDVDDYINKKTK